jgi:hypothetical protein
MPINSWEYRRAKHGKKKSYYFRTKKPALSRQGLGKAMQYSNSNFGVAERVENISSLSYQKTHHCGERLLRSTMYKGKSSEFNPGSAFFYFWTVFPGSMRWGSMKATALIAKMSIS